MSHEFEREVLCCGASIWGKVISWIQIICSVFSILVAKVTLVDVLYLGEKGFNEQMKSIVMTPELMEKLEIGYGGIVATLIASIAISIIGLFMGVIFLQGIKQRNTRYLKTWIIYIVICWSLLCLTTTVMESPIGVAFVEGTFITLIHIFVIWVALAVMLDIRQDHTISMNTITSNLNFVRLEEEHKH
ncbi:unnamed protein product [Allacma fusca]|uniref:Uncharacterized protein n=1 Tax=Allacma fusca TaxID=39272 RepID=A0A8J2NUJ4_9HEXA|nr:unnamed protein product [Allacma fusca]